MTTYQLPSLPGEEAQRLEVGWLIANVWMVEGRRIRDAIPVVCTPFDRTGSWLR